MLWSQSLACVPHTHTSQRQISLLTFSRFHYALVLAGTSKNEWFAVRTHFVAPVHPLSHFSNCSTFISLFYFFHLANLYLSLRTAVSLPFQTAHRRLLLWRKMQWLKWKVWERERDRLEIQRDTLEMQSRDGSSRWSADTNMSSKERKSLCSLRHY